MINAYKNLVKLLKTKTFSWVVILLAFAQGAYIAVVSRYPMAFDEAYHYNHIKLHAQTWSPILVNQPPGPATYGAVSRDPSQLYHFLLSLPYRLLDSLQFSEMQIQISLRIFSLLLFCLGLVIFKKLLLKTKASEAAINASLLFFVLIPTVPTLSGQINYDNLQFLLIALNLYLLVLVFEKFKAKNIPLILILQLLIVALAGSLTKFSFLPFLLADFLVVSWLAIRYKTTFKVSKLRKDWASYGPLTKYALIILTIILSSLFVWFYGVNTVKYHNPVVQCHQVLGPERCSTFEPWQRNYDFAKSRKTTTQNPAKFAVDWVSGMFYRSFFVINGASGSKRYNNFEPRPIAGMAIILTIVGAILLAKYLIPTLKNDATLSLILFASLIYLIALIGRNYNDYLQLKQMVAINGRYLHPLLPAFILTMIVAYQRAFYKHPKIKLTIFAVSLLLFCLGGSITGFLYYSDANWYFIKQT